MCNTIKSRKAGSIQGEGGEIGQVRTGRNMKRIIT